MEREQLSALMDGELGEQATQGTLDWLRKNPDERQAWNEYHLIGDVLRGGDFSHVRLGEAISQRLSQEPTLLAPRFQRQQKEESVPRYARWAAVAAAISVVTLAGWSLQRTPASQVALNSAAPSPVVASNSGSIQSAKVSAAVSQNSAAEMERFAVLHRQFTPLSGFQSADFEVTTPVSR